MKAVPRCVGGVLVLAYDIVLVMHQLFFVALKCLQSKIVSAKLPSLPLQSAKITIERYEGRLQRDLVRIMGEGSR